MNCCKSVIHIPTSFLAFHNLTELIAKESRIRKTPYVWGNYLIQSSLYDVAKIMDVDEETLHLLPKIKYKGNLLNPWGGELLNIFRSSNLSPIKTVLDIPCGQGGVSVYWAKEYGVTVEGYDLFGGFIDNANEYAAANNVKGRCHYAAEDIRAVIEKGKEYDLVLWSAPPHLWDNYEQTVENLRKCAKPGGYLVIADAYLYSEEQKSVQPEYETLEETRKSVTAYGDIIVRLTDYKDTLWASNYQSDRNAIIKAIGSSENRREKDILTNYLKNVNEMESFDTECFGLYILVLQVHKNTL